MLSIALLLLAADLENSYVVPSPISRTKTPEQAIDDLIGNFQNLGVAKRKY